MSRPWRRWPLCRLGWCGGHVQSDQHDIWWQCDTCGEQRHRAPRPSFDVLVQAYGRAEEVNRSKTRIGD